MYSKFIFVLVLLTVVGLCRSCLQQGCVAYDCENDQCSEINNCGAGFKKVKCGCCDICCLISYEGGICGDYIETTCEDGLRCVNGICQK
ncbi:venom protein 302-like [Diabrotica virgifera virgifera]|uniref:Venom protein 302-like n=1 Tax=Diabrotica virgifera virgifera TaxID=50390 RepID=A0A6P7F357_DIAVI|nr:venom protein 302-like [Diabrotica virgifera virgifera]